MSVDALEAHDNFAGVRNALHAMGEAAQEWAGIPMPLEDLPLVLEPTWPRRDDFAKIGQKEYEPAPMPPGFKKRGRFHSTHKRGDVLIWEENGRVEWGFERGAHHFDNDLATLGASFAWGIEQEARAVNLLAELVRHHQFKMYMLTGMFLERSKRSGVMYMFRRLKPTVAIAQTPDGKNLRILCCLCMHPVGYYADSYAGAMCPTDDVIAHLMLMRADEHLFWRRSNQHPAYRPQAGL